MIWGLEALAHHENFGRLGSGGLGLCSFDLIEKMIENEEQGVVVLGSENLGNESTALSQDLSCQLQGIE